MPTNTPNFNWYLPIVQGDLNVWGGYLNSNISNQDTLFRQAINSFIGTSAPSVAQAGTVWLDSTTNPYVYKIYDGTQWVTIGTLNTTTHTFTPTNSTGGSSIGDMKFSAQGASHGSWLLCNGAGISTTTYSGLFAVIGYAFGGAGVTFNLPDLRGRVPGATGTGFGLTPRTMGNSVGEETHQLTQAELPNYNLMNDVCVGNSLGVSVRGTVAGTGNSYFTLNSGGSNTPHNTMQPTLFVGNYFIYSGV